MPQKPKFSHASDVSFVVPGLVHINILKIKSHTGVGSLFQNLGPYAMISLCTEHLWFIISFGGWTVSSVHFGLSRAKSYQWSSSYLPPQNKYKSSSSHESQPTPSSWLKNPNNIRWWVHTTKLLIMYFASFHLTPLYSVKTYFSATCTQNTPSI
jgi:hypothetical protein